jgi:hypothetical protein
VRRLATCLALGAAGCDRELEPPCDAHNVPEGYCVVTIAADGYEYAGFTGVGDVDGDGRDDLALGWSDWGSAPPVGGSDEGLTTILPAGDAIHSLPPLEGRVWWTLPHFGGTTQVSARSGAGLGAPGDVTGDGVPDLAIAAPGATLGQPEGAVYLVDGTVVGKANLNEHALARIRGEQADDEPGYNLQVLGDNDGDGISDLLVDVPNRLRLYVVSGASRGELSLGDSMAVVRSWHYYTWPQAGIGDLDGDGFPDLVVVDSDGGISVLPGPFAGDAPVDDLAAVSFGYDWDIPNGDPVFRSPVPCSVGDLDGDGKADLALIDDVYGEGLTDFGGGVNGAVYLHPGPGDDLTTFQEMAGQVLGGGGDSHLGDGPKSCVSLGPMDGAVGATWFLSNESGVADELDPETHYVRPESVYRIDGMVEGVVTIDEVATRVYQRDNDVAYYLYSSGVGWSMAPAGDYDGNGSPDLLMNGLDYDSTLVLLTGR